MIRSPGDGKAHSCRGYRVRYQERRLRDEGELLICGHIHEKWLKIRNMVNVSVDVWNFFPASVEQVLAVAQQGGDVKFHQNPEHGDAELLAKDLLAAKQWIKKKMTLA